MEGTSPARRHLHSREKEMVYTVHKYFLEEKVNKRPSLDFSRAVARTVLRFYARKEIPSLHKIKEELQESISFKGCTESLRKILHQIGVKKIT